MKTKRINTQETPADTVELGNVKIATNGKNPQVKTKKATTGDLVTFTAENGTSYQGDVVAVTDGFAVLDRVKTRA